MNANIVDVKKAFREKAKQYHPDMNHSPDANENFIKVNEAYEFLLNVLKHKNITYTSSKKPPENPVWRTYNKEERESGDYSAYYRAYDAFYKKWFENEQEHIKERARFYANQRFSEFKKSKIYRTSQVLYTIFDYMYYALGVFIVGLFVFVFCLFLYNFFKQIIRNDGTGKSVILGIALVFYIYVFFKFRKLIKNKFRY